ncbi:ankyrin repeat domain-containing protein [Gemmatimonas sp.]
MSRQLSLRTTVPLLKQEAKRWFALLQRADAGALARFHDAWPQAPQHPTLRDVQHALAREYGANSWVALIDRVSDMAIDRQSHDDRLATLLSHGWTGDVTTAARLRTRYPELATANVFTAAACGDVAAVQRFLQRDPTLVAAIDPVRGWTALAHVTYGRLDATHAVAMARLLLDAGADVHFRFDDGWGNPFTVLTGVAGDGEGEKPPHPLMRPLADVLFERGIDPFDTQLLYNTSLHHDDTSWLERLWAESERCGITELWRAREGRMLGGKFPSTTLDYLLGNAITRHREARTRWLLAHGASAHAVHAYSGRPLHTEASMHGFSRGVALLESHGATAQPLRDDQALAVALIQGDEALVRRLVAADSTLIQRSGVLHTAALHGQTAAVELLLGLGGEVNAVDHEGATPLHRAAQNGHVHTLTALLGVGGDLAHRDARFHATALEWAAVLGKQQAVDLLVPISHDVRALARVAAVERLNTVLRDAPHLANERLPGASAPTPLFCLPDDDEQGVAVAKVLLAFGANPQERDANGKSAIEAAKARGLDASAAAMARHDTHHTERA